jgi:hypothetical protein
VIGAFPRRLAAWFKAETVAAPQCGYLVPDLASSVVQFAPPSAGEPDGVGPVDMFQAMSRNSADFPNTLGKVYPWRMPNVASICIVARETAALSPNCLTPEAK